MSVHMLTLQASVHPELEVPLTIPQSEWRSKNEVRDSRRRKPIRKMARKRAQPRWSALLARISRQVRLERSLWADFAAHANRLYKPAFIAAFDRCSCAGMRRASGWLSVRFLCQPRVKRCVHKARLATPRPRAGRCRHLRPVEESNALISGRLGRRC